jgi:UDP-N-acetylglucosamine 2-epimerase (non-hydrolysing)
MMPRSFRRRSSDRHPAFSLSAKPKVFYMSTTGILHVVGARPNFMKAASVIRAAREQLPNANIVVHTGQHYDAGLSGVFFDELGLPDPTYHLAVGSGTHAEQTGTIMMRFEGVVRECDPALVVVYGDVNSTMACALVCAKLGIRVAHVEAGLRSFDRRMPEEINRVVTDHLSDFLFITEESGRKNLMAEGIPTSKIFFVGNTMVDTLLHFREQAMKSTILKQCGLQSGNYGVLTLHRPGNVDAKESLEEILVAVEKLSRKIPLVFPCHPRTRAQLRAFHLPLGTIQILDPLGYLDFLSLMAQATLVLTDSGGIQEETTVLGVPCLTIRENTERPITTSCGSNILTGISRIRIQEEAEKILGGTVRRGTIPPCWDGQAGQRIGEILARVLTTV